MNKLFPHNNIAEDVLINEYLSKNSLQILDLVEKQTAAIHRTVQDSMIKT